MDTDRNLLLGVMAFQSDLATSAQVAHALAQCAAGKARTLPDVLVEQGLLTPSARAGLERQAESKLQEFGGDVKASLSTFSQEVAPPSRASAVGPQATGTLPPIPPALGNFPTGTIDGPGTKKLDKRARLPESGGHYKVERLYSQGGLGRVWLARDESLGRDVALKDLRPERAGAPRALARFLREAKVTGQLEHPGIVPVYELSRRPADDQPFYTMRFIRGRTLAEAVDVYHAKPLSDSEAAAGLRELLTAFVGVCNAVAYAHSRGVLHRDLKPQNVALGDYGEAIVLDWGLAKVLGEADSEEPNDQAPVDLAEEDTGHGTIFGSALGTPSYMAPEQAEGLLHLIDVRSDVYGLGGILYQVLTGRPPFTAADRDSLLAQVVNDPPTSPRDLVHGVPMPLQAVCLKALAKKPADRYAAAKELASEVQRWLADEPVTAYREPWTTRLGRWGKRHRTLVTSGGLLLTAAAIFLAVLTGVIARGRRETQKEAAKAQAINRFLVEDLLAEAAPEKNPRGKQVTVEEVLNKAAAKVDTAFPGQPEVEVAIRGVIGDTYYYLGLHPAAEPQFRKALEIARRELQAEDPLTLTAMANLAMALDTRGELKEAESLLRQALEARRRILGAEHPDTLQTMNNLGALLGAVGKYSEAEALARDYLEGRRRALGGEHEETLLAMNNLGQWLSLQGRSSEAETLYRQALAICESKLRPGHPHTLLVKNNLALLLRQGSRLLEAEALYREAWQASRKERGPEHPETLRIMSNLAGTLQDLGERGEAERLFREVVPLARKAWPAGSLDLSHRLLNAGRVLTENGKPQEAEPLLREGREIQEKALPRGHWRLGRADSLYGACLVALGRKAEGEPLLLRGYETLEAAQGAPRSEVNAALDRIVQFYEAWGKPDSAAEWRARRVPEAKSTDRPGAD